MLLRRSSLLATEADPDIVPPRVGLTALGLVSTGRCWLLLARRVRGATLLGGLGAVLLLAAQPAFASSGPSVGATFASGLTDVKATLNAEVNPNGAPTTYQFQYGTDPSYGRTAPATPAGIGSGSTEIPVAETIAGLQPDTTYHFRVVAVSSAGVTSGPRRTFTTYPPGSLGLPDGRAYEQVTPLDKGGANPGGQNGDIQASVSGERITYLVEANMPGGEGSTDFPLFLASRTPEGWSSRGMMPPTSPSATAKIAGWSPDLATALIFSTEPAPGSYYLRDAATGSFTPIFASANAQVAPAAFASDTTHFLFETSEQLLPAAPAGVPNVYEYNHGTVTLADVLPDGSVPPTGALAGPYDWASGNLELGGPTSNYYTENTLSADGSRVFFTAAGTGQIYARTNDTSTVRVSASQKTNGSGPGGTDPNGPQPAAWLAATPDGSHVLFASCEQLTNDSTAVSTNGCTARRGKVRTGNDLYSFDTQTNHLTDLTVDANLSDPLGADVQGVLGQSTDGSYVYFAANGVLAPGATPGGCEGIQTEAAACSLYLAHDGSITFIARLDPSRNRTGSSGDAFDWLPGFQPQGGPTEEKTSRVTPDGKTLLFRSNQPLAGYDSRGTDEFYRFDAVSGHIDCVSCNPTGSPPSGPAALRSIPVGFGFLGRQGETVHLTRNLSADGRHVFFETPDALVPSDTNGPCTAGSQENTCVDVYEWETNGAGACTRPAGCLYLISSGKSTIASYFADASVSGNDVFFFTDAQLVGQDRDGNVDLYDARVGGGIASQNPPPSPPPCNGENCKAPPSVPPSDQSFTSADFIGPGNLAPPGPIPVSRPRSLTRAQKLAKALQLCRRLPRRKRASCIARAHKLYRSPNTASKRAKHSQTGRK